MAKKRRYEKTPANQYLRGAGWYRVDTSGVLLWKKRGSDKEPVETHVAVKIQLATDRKYQR